MISSSSIEFYSKILAKKRGWVPIKPTGKQDVVEGSTTTLQRALSLSKLELPVGNWITDELSKQPDFPDLITKLLQINISEEINHDLALNNIRDVFAVPDHYDAQVDNFIVRGNELAELYSPIMVSAVLESSIFFVILPMFRFLGSVGMRTTSQDISIDEVGHVSTNLQLCRDLGYRKGKALDTFRQDIMDFLTEDLPFFDDNKYLTSSFWQESSRNLYNQGKANNLTETKRAVMQAFFETPNTSFTYLQLDHMRKPQSRVKLALTTARTVREIIDTCQDQPEVVELLVNLALMDAMDCSPDYGENDHNDCGSKTDSSFGFGEYNPDFE